MTIVIAMLVTVGAACGDGGRDRGSKLPASDVEGRAVRFAECARESEYEVVVPEPPNERTDFLRQEGFRFAEVDLEEQPLLLFAAIVDFFPTRSDAARARDRIGASLFGPSPVRIGSVIVKYTDEPGTSKRSQVEAVVEGCIER